MSRFIAIIFLLLLPLSPLWADVGLPAISVNSDPDGSQTYTLSIQVLVLMTVLTLLPAGLMMMTAFTRIIIVLSILRQAIGTAQTPTNQTLIGLALFLTFFVMMPVFDKVYQEAVTPYLEEKIEIQEALGKAAAPLRDFMLAQTRETDLELFMELSNNEQVATPEEVPFSVLVPSFVTSELKTAFQIGFLMFIPFLIIDLVVASVLMAMGMMMLSPLIISLPFKIMLFVLIDGWALIMGTLASSFYV
ncbi:MAG: flagellar type III secretion system pore protein FliP [Gammaproteobacteria bacterium]|nr:flagellar type III secretion system pore protein FliP [Gammaproteobacteria bacterium]